MIDTDRSRGIIKWIFVIGSFTIAFIQFVPTRLSDLLSAPTYIGYIMSFQIAIIILLSLSIFYLISHINEVRNGLEEEIDKSVNYYISRISEIELEEDYESDENDENPKKMTDGGNIKNLVDDNDDTTEYPSDDGLGSIKPKSRTETSGTGLLLGLTVGGLIGLLVSLDTVILGGVIGATLGNEFEYRLSKQENTINITFEKKSQLYDIASSSKRREIIKILSTENSVELSELAKKVSSIENSTAVEDLTDDQLKRSYASLVQTHIPKLEQNDIIELDSQKDIITKGENFETGLSIVTNPEDILDIEPNLFTGQSIDEIMDILSNDRRRLVLDILTSNDDKISLGELAELVAAEEIGKSVDELSSSERKRVYISLYQTHLPKLEENRIIEFNMDEGEVKLAFRNDSGQILESEGLLWSKTQVTPSTLYWVVSVLALAIAVGQSLNIEYISDIFSLVWFSIYIIIMASLILYKSLS